MKNVTITYFLLCIDGAILNCAVIKSISLLWLYMMLYFVYILRLTLNLLLGISHKWRPSFHYRWLLINHRICIYILFINAFIYCWCKNIFLYIISNLNTATDLWFSTRLFQTIVINLSNCLVSYTVLFWRIFYFA